MAMDATNIYFPLYDILKIPIAGGTPVTVAPTMQNVAALTVDAVNVYWLETDTAVVKSPLAGGIPTTLASIPAVDLPGSLPTGAWMAVDDTNIYWVTTPAAATDTTRSSVVAKVPIAGGSVTTLAVNRSEMRGLGVNSTSVVWAEWDGLFALTPK
jgi:hypothetical protein